MEPRFQYAKTDDGVNIAYGEAGEGKPIIVMTPPGFSHAEIAWRMFAGVLQSLAADFHAIWFDSRGSGLSDRGSFEFSLDALTLDLEAVVERTEGDSFALVAWTNAAPLAISYAAAHPDRVSHLILVEGWARPADWMDTVAYQSSTALLQLDWSLYTETFGQVLWAYSDATFGRLFADYMRESADAETHKAQWKAAEGYDVTELLPLIRTPTLIIHSKNNRLYPLAIGRWMAAAIPGARLTLMDDDVTYAPVPGLVKAFVSTDSTAPGRTAGIPSGMTAILFADIADSTGLTERLGDAPFRDKARLLDDALRGIIRDHSGTPIEGKLLGDGVLAVFTGARQAIDAAIECGRAGSEAGLPLHLGLHAGDVIHEDDNVYGGAVNIAARISGLAAPGEVLVSDTLRGLARTSAGASFVDRGEQSLKGVGDAVRVWAVEERVDG